MGQTGQIQAMKKTTNIERPARMSWGWTLGALPLVYLWWMLINQLRVPWSTNPQYAYGWAVPFLCVYLVWQRIWGGDRRLEVGDWERQVDQRTSIFHLPSPSYWFLFALCAVLFAPTRLVQ